MTGCASSNTPEVVVKTVYIKEKLPEGLLTCKALPSVPKNPVKEFDNIRYVAELYAAYMDCAYKIQKIRENVEVIKND